MMWRRIEGPCTDSERTGDSEWHHSAVDADIMYSFMTSNPFSTPQELTSALHRAVIEVYTLQQAGRPWSSLSCAPISQEDFTGDVQVVPSADSPGVYLTYPTEATRDFILSSMENNDIGADHEDDSQLEEASSSEFQVDKDSGSEDVSMKDSTIEGSERATDMSHLDELISSWDPSWFSIPLKNLDIKFAVCSPAPQQTPLC